MIGDIISRVLTEFKADTSDMRAQVRELKGDQKELAQAELDAAEARNEQFEDWVKGLAKVGVSLMAAKETASIIWEGYNDSIKEARLESAAMGVDLEKLSQAANGLKTHMELLEFAAKANKSAFKNSQEDMELAERAMRALEQRGIGAAEAQEAVTQALVSGRTRGLEPFGVVVDKHIESLKDLGDENLTLAQRTEVHANALKALRVIASDVTDGQNELGDSMKQSQVKLSDSWDELKKGLGQLAVAMQPLLDALTHAVNLIGEIAKIPGGVGAVAGFAIGGPIGAGIGYAMTNPDVTSAFGINQVLAAARGPGMPNLDFDTEHPPGDQMGVGDAFGSLFGGVRGVIGAGDYAGQQPMARFDEWLKQAKDRYDKAKALAEQIRKERIKIADETAKTLTDALVKNLEAGQYHLGYQDNGDLVSAPKDQVLGVDINKIMVANEAQGYNAFNAKKEQSFLEKTFGPVSEFDLYHEAFTALSGAVKSSLDAWISGSESAGAAFQKFVAKAVESIADQMLVESLKFAAYALGALAFGDVAHAGMFAATSAEFAAGAVLAAVVASQLGGGGGTTSTQRSGSSSSASARAPQSYSSAPSGGGGTTTNIFPIGDPFANDSPRMRQRLMTQAVKRAGMATDASGQAA